METMHLHPNDIGDLDKNQISLISLKDGNMIVIDDDAPEKPKSQKKSAETVAIEKKVDRPPQPLTVSDHLTIAFMGRENNSNKNIDEYTNIKTEKVFVKSDFNLISQISKNGHFSFTGKEKEKINSFRENASINMEKINNMEDTKLSNNFSPIMTSDANMKKNINNNISLNDQIKLDSYENNNNNNNNISANQINSTNIKDKLGEEEKAAINSRIQRKSRNYLGKLEQLFMDRNKPIVKAVISLNIPSDNPQELNATQRQFNLLVSQLRKKQSKYKWPNDLTYQRYYELYKDKNSKLYNGLLDPNINRIKYYQEAEMEDLGNDVLYSGNESVMKSPKNNNILNSSNNITFVGSGNNSLNKSMNYNFLGGNNDINVNLNKTAISSRGTRTRPGSENKIYNTKLVGNSLGYSSALVFPSNRFASKLGTGFFP